MKNLGIFDLPRKICYTGDSFNKGYSGIMVEEIYSTELDKMEECLMDVEKLTKELAEDIEEVQKIGIFQMYKLKLEWIRQKIRLTERGIC